MRLYAFKNNKLIKFLGIDKQTLRLTTSFGLSLLFP